MSNPFATLWTVAHQVPLSMEFSRQEYRSGLSFSSPGDLPDQGIEPESYSRGKKKTLLILSNTPKPLSFFRFKFKFPFVKSF